MIFLRDRNLRTVPNTYIISLALGDLLVLFFAVPFVSVIYISDSWPFGDAMCKLTEFMRDVSIGVTVFTLMALSADRYLAIVSSIRRVSNTLKLVSCYCLSALQHDDDKWLVRMVL